MAYDSSRAASSHAVLSIADVEIFIHSDHRLVHYPDPPYYPFLTPGASRGTRSPDIDVEALVAPARPNDSPALFDSDIAWRMQPEGDGYRVSFRRLDGESIHTVLCSDRATTDVSIYVRQDAGYGALPGGGIFNPVHYPLDQVILMNHLAGRGGMITHAAAAVFGGKTLLFPGVSGAGKSTFSQRFIDAGLGDTLLSDDRVILRRARGAGQGMVCGEAGTGGGAERIVAWGTPWPGDAMVARNEAAPLGAVLFLLQAEADAVEPITPGVAMRRLMPMISCPWYDPDRLPGVLETCARVVEGVPCYDLHFKREGEVAPLLAGLSLG